MTKLKFCRVVMMVEARDVRQPGVDGLPFTSLVLFSGLLLVTCQFSESE